MNALLDFLKSFGDAIVAVFDFVIGFFQDLIYIIELTGTTLAKVPNYFSWLPSEVVSLIVVLISIVVIYKILGREG